jgi:transposase-like protein
MLTTRARRSLTYRSRRRWTPEDAKTALAALSESGLSIRAFAAREGLSAQRLFRWRRCLGEDAPSSLSFEELIPAAAPASSAGGATSEERERLEIVLRSGVVVRVPESFTASALSRLLDVLSGQRSC